MEHDSHIIQSLLNKLCKKVEQALDSGEDPMHVFPENENEVVMKKRHRCSKWTLPKLNHCVARKFVNQLNVLHVLEN